MPIDESDLVSYGDPYAYAREPIVDSSGQLVTQGGDILVPVWRRGNIFDLYGRGNIYDVYGYEARLQPSTNQYFGSMTIPQARAAANKPKQNLSYLNKPRSTSSGGSGGGGSSGGGGGGGGSSTNKKFGSFSIPDIQKRAVASTPSASRPELQKRISASNQGGGGGAKTTSGAQKFGTMTIDQARAAITAGQARKKTPAELDAMIQAFNLVKTNEGIITLRLRQDKEKAEYNLRSAQQRKATTTEMRDLQTQVNNKRAAFQTSFNKWAADHFQKGAIIGYRNSDDPAYTALDYIVNMTGVSEAKTKAAIEGIYGTPAGDPLVAGVGQIPLPMKYKMPLMVIAGVFGDIAHGEFTDNRMSPGDIWNSFAMNAIGVDTSKLSGDWLHNAGVVFQGMADKLNVITQKTLPPGAKPTADGGIQFDDGEYVSKDQLNVLAAFSGPGAY